MAHHPPILRSTWRTCLALLLLAGLGARIQAASTLDVRITVVLDYTIDVVWNVDDTTADKTWAINPVSLNGIVHTNDSPDLTVKNNTSVPVNLTIGLIDPTSKGLSACNWTHVVKANHDAQDEYTIGAARVATPSAPTANWAADNSYIVALPAAYAATTQLNAVGTPLAASGGTLPVNLAFWAPPSVSTVTAGGIVVRITAAAN